MLLPPCVSLEDVLPVHVRPVTYGINSEEAQAGMRLPSGQHKDPGTYLLPLQHCSCMLR